jgi:Ulp1 family protease
MFSLLSPSMLQMKTPQQHNGNDCGVYTLMVVECFLMFLESNRGDDTTDQNAFERELERKACESIARGDADKFRYRMQEEVAKKCLPKL